MTAFANFLAEYRDMPAVKHALEHDPNCRSHYASLAALLEQIEMRDVPRAAALYEPAMQILAQKGLTPAGRVDVLFAFLRIRDGAILGLGTR